MAHIPYKGLADLFGARAGDRKAAPAASNQSEKAHRRDLPGGEQRRWTCGLIYKTHSSTTIVENWLESHATGEWVVALEDMDENREGKTLKILFEQEQDKKAFVAQFAGR